MITSKITGQTYEPSECVYITNPVQCQRYFKYLGADFFLDILYTSEKREDALVFVWKRCPETREAKIKWDNHEL
jgi:hypothetical protein